MVISTALRRVGVRGVTLLSAGHGEDKGWDDAGNSVAPRPETDQEMV